MDNQAPQLTVDVPEGNTRWRFLEWSGLKMVAAHVLFGEQVVQADKTITAVWNVKGHDRFVTISVDWIINREDFREKEMEK